MSSSFLQRFKGKTTHLRKNAVHQILGTMQPIPYLHPTNQNYKNFSNPMNTIKTTLPFNINYNSNQDPKNQTNLLPLQPTLLKTNKTDNPFFNHHIQYHQDNRQKLIQQLNKQTKQQQQQNLSSEKISKQTRLPPHPLQKKNSASKEWVKLGGLGANIGGEQWLYRKNKQSKMQQFSAIVKSINAQKLKHSQSSITKQKYPKLPNNRKKAIDYSKNIQKPQIRRTKWNQDQQYDSFLQYLQRQTDKSTKYNFKNMIHFNY